MIAFVAVKAWPGEFTMCNIGSNLPTGDFA